MRAGTRAIVIAVAVCILASCADQKPSVPPSLASSSASPSPTAVPTPADIVAAFIGTIQGKDARFSLRQTTKVNFGDVPQTFIGLYDRIGADTKVVTSVHSGDLRFSMTSIRKDGVSAIQYGTGPWEAFTDPTRGELNMGDLQPADLAVQGSVTHKGEPAVLLRNVRPIPYRGLGGDPSLTATTGEITTLEAFVRPDGMPIDVSLGLSIFVGGYTITSTSTMAFRDLPDGASITAPDVVPTLVIASSLPRGDAQSSLNHADELAIAAAVRERGDTINGWHIVTQPIPETTAGVERQTATQTLIDPAVVAYLGPTDSDNVVAAIGVTCPSGVAEVVFANTYPGFTRSVPDNTSAPDGWYRNCRRNFFRVVPSQDAESRAAAAWAKGHGMTSAWIVTDGSILSEIQAASFGQEAKRRGIKIKGTSTITDSQVDFKPATRAIAKAKPSLVFYAGSVHEGTVRLWLELRAAVPKASLMGTSAIDDGVFLRAIADTHADASFTRAIVDSRLRAGADLQFNRLVDSETARSDHAAYAYDAARVVLDAIDRATVDGTKDLAAIRSRVLLEVAATTDFKSSVGGTWSFDAAGDTSPSQVSLYRVDEIGYWTASESLSVP